MRIESSIITSLSELRAIEQQRVAEERATVERERAAAIAAAKAAELARIEAAEARLQAEREERIRIEIARAEAERDARVRVEAAEATERARLAAQLEERRMAEELELRRAEVAKKRPTWMLVVTGVAFAAAIALTGFAIDRSLTMERAKEQERAAQVEKAKAKEQLRELGEQMRALQIEIDAFDGRLAGLQQKLVAAQTAADRKRVADEIAAESAAKREVQRKLDAAAAAKAHADRVKVRDYRHCQDTPLGCIDDTSKRR